MLTAVVVSNLLTCPIGDPNPNADFYLDDVDGYGPVAATVNSSAFGGLDGEYPTGSQVGKRNLVLTFALNNVDPALETLYPWFVPKNGILLRFESDNHVDVEIDGIVESAEPDRFSQEPTLQVSIVCLKPFFRSPNPLSIVGGIAEADPDPVELVYNGTQINGITLQMLTSDNNLASTVFIEHHHDAMGAGQWRPFELDDITIASDRQLSYSSLQGRKFAQAEDVGGGGVVNSLLYAMNAQSFWLTLWPGSNLIRVRTPDSPDAFLWGLQCTELFGGI